MKSLERLFAILPMAPVWVAQKIGDLFSDGKRILVASGRQLSEDEKRDVIIRIRFFAPSLGNRVSFQTVVTMRDFFSESPILVLNKGKKSYLSQKVWDLRRAVFDVDPRQNPTDGWDWCGLSWYLLTHRPDREEVKNRFKSYVGQLKALNLAKSYVFGTGVSLARAKDVDWSHGYRIVCNTIVKDAHLWKHINPHFIVAGDAIYHFGFTEFAKAFRRDLANRLSETETYFLYPESFHPIVARELSEFSHRLLPAPTGPSLRVHDDLTKRFQLPRLPNVLSLLLLPLACTLSRDIYLWGFDGRAPDDELFWANSPAHSYPNLMVSLLDAHPAFFEHYVPSSQPSKYVMNVHGDQLDKNLLLAEQDGWHFVMMHKSWTPTLQKRFKTCL